MLKANDTIEALGRITRTGEALTKYSYSGGLRHYYY